MALILSDIISATFILLKKKGRIKHMRWNLHWSKLSSGMKSASQLAQLPKSKHSSQSFSNFQSKEMTTLLIWELLDAEDQLMLTCG